MYRGVLCVVIGYILDHSSLYLFIQLTKQNISYRNLFIE